MSFTTLHILIWDSTPENVICIMCEWSLISYKHISSSPQLLLTFFQKERNEELHNQTENLIYLHIFYNSHVAEAVIQIDLTRTLSQTTCLWVTVSVYPQEWSRMYDACSTYSESMGAPIPPPGFPGTSSSRTSKGGSWWPPTCLAEGWTLSASTSSSTTTCPRIPTPTCTEWPVQAGSGRNSLFQSMALYSGCYLESRWI